MIKAFLKWGTRIFLALLLITSSSLISLTGVKAQGEDSVPTQKMEIEARQLDSRALVLHEYFAQFDSPLQDFSQDFIDAADAYSVDWKLVPAIAGVESTFGRNTPGGYNSWGWGVYGTQAIYFNSYRDGIFTVTKGLKENYIDKGLKDPYQINIAYASSPYWGWKVSYFMDDINRFAQKQSSKNNPSLGDTTSKIKVAATSAQLTPISSVNVSKIPTLAFNAQ